jgi:hypothetical protein
MTLSVEVETGRRDRALVVPTAALVGASAGDSAAVHVLRDGRVEARRCAWACARWTAPRCCSGLAAGDVVLLGASPAPGQRAQADTSAAAGTGGQGQRRIRRGAGQRHGPLTRRNGRHHGDLAGLRTPRGTALPARGPHADLLIIVGVAAGVAVVAYISALITGPAGQHAGQDPGRAGACHPEPAGRGGAAAAAAAGRHHRAQQTQPRAQRLRSVANWQALVPLLEAMPGVAGGVADGGRRRAWRCAARPAQSIALVGVDLDRYDRIVGLRQGGGRARTAGAGRGHHRPRAGRRPGRARGRPADGGDRRRQRATVRVTALVDLGVRELNRRTVIVPLRAAQSLLGLPGGATNLDLTLTDVWAAQAWPPACAGAGPTRWKAGRRPTRSWCRR